MYDPRVELEPTILIHGWVWLVVGAALLGSFLLARRRPDYGLALVIAALPLYQVRGHLGVPTTFLELLLGAVLLAVATRYRIYRPPRTPYDIWLLLWAGAGLLAALLGPDLKEGLGLWRAFFFEPALFFYALTAVFQKHDLQAILIGAIGAIIVLVIWTVYLLGFGHAITYDHRLLGPYQSPNYFTLLLAPLLILTATWPKRELVWTRIAVIAAGAVMFAAANSRGAEIGLIASVAVAVLFLAGRLRKQVIIAAAVLLVLAGAVFGPRLISHSEQQVVSARPVIWREALAVIREHPLFGNGPGQFQAEFRRRVAGNPNETLYVAPQALNPHNVWLVTWTEWGLLTLAGLLALVVTAVRTIIRRLSYWQIVPATMLTAILVHGAVDTSILKNDLAPLFVLVLALAVLVPHVSARRIGAPR